MADKSFGVKELNLIQPSGSPTITSPNNLTINATQVSISTDVSIGNQVVSNILVGTDILLALEPQFQEVLCTLD